jgi:hypothetical protein
MTTYKAPMLTEVDYTLILDDEDDDSDFSLTELEAGILRDCRDFLTLLKTELFKENLMQVPELVIAHLCAYLGAVVTIHTVRHAEKLEPSVIKLIKHQANAAYELFNQHPINKTVKTQAQKKINIEHAREKAPGSIVVQTVRLGRTIMDMLEELRDHFRRKQSDLFCSHETLIKLMMLVGSQKCAEWRKWLDGLSDYYVINQFAIQMGWLIGYFSHLDCKKPDDTQYFDYGLPIMTLFREHIYKLMEAYAHAEHAHKEAESMELMEEIHQLSEEAYKQRLPAVSDLQKQIAKVHANSEKILIDLMNQCLEIKIILMSVFYFWFILEGPLHTDHPESIDDEHPMEHMTVIIDLVKKTTLALPAPDLSSEIRALNEKMQTLKKHLFHPEQLDNVAHENVKEHTEQVNQAIHAMTCNYIKQKIHIQVITNVLFGHWLRLSVFFGVSENEWQKMDYYLPEILIAVRKYLSEALSKR